MCNITAEKCIAYDKGAGPIGCDTGFFITFAVVMLIVAVYAGYKLYRSIRKEEEMIR